MQRGYLQWISVENTTKNIYEWLERLNHLKEANIGVQTEFNATVGVRTTQITWKYLGEFLPDENILSDTKIIESDLLNSFFKKLNGIWCSFLNTDYNEAKSVGLDCHQFEHLHGNSHVKLN